MSASKVTPSGRLGLALEHEHRLDASARLLQLVRIVENLSESEADLLILVRARQGLDLRDEQLPRVEPARVELRGPSMRPRDLEPAFLQRIMEGQERLFMSLCPRSRPLMSTIRPLAEWTGTSQPRRGRRRRRPLVQAWGVCRRHALGACDIVQTGKKLLEPVAIDDVHVPLPAARLLRGDELLAELVSRVDHQR